VFEVITIAIFICYWKWWIREKFLS